MCAVVAEGGAVDAAVQCRVSWVRRGSVVLVLSAILGFGSIASAPDAGASGYPMVRPASGTVVSGWVYCVSRAPHGGVDIGGSLGAPIYAAYAGWVTITNEGNSGGGKGIVLDHGDAWATYYGHLDNWAVGAGQWVTRGQVIGWMGNTGNAGGFVHLHFAVRLNGMNQPIDAGFAPVCAGTWVDGLSVLPMEFPPLIPPAFLQVAYRTSAGLSHTFFNGAFWQTSAIPNTGDATGAPGSVEYADTYQVFYRRGGDSQLRHTFFNGGWNPPSNLPDTASSAPAAAMYGSELQVAYRRNSGANLRHTFFNGVSWQGPYQIPNTASASAGPGLGAYNGQLQVVFRVGGQLWHTFWDPNLFAWRGPYQIPNVGDASNRPTAVQFGAVLQVAYKPSGSNSVSYVYFDPAVFAWVGPFPVPGAAATTSPAMTVHNGTELQIGYQQGTAIDLGHVFFEYPVWNPPGTVAGTSAQISEPSLISDQQ